MIEYVYMYAANSVDQNMYWANSIDLDELHCN